MKKAVETNPDRKFAAESSWRLVLNIDLLLATPAAKPAPHVIRYIPLDVAVAAAESGTLLVQRKISIHHLLSLRPAEGTPISPSREQTMPQVVFDDGRNNLMGN